MFLDDERKDKDFVENCRRWLARGHDAEFVSINETDSMENVAQHEKIFVWDGHYTKTDGFISDLVNITIFSLLID